MTLREKQSEFVRMIALLIHEAHRLGYQLTFGEAWRTPEQAALNAAKGSGIKRSLHCDRLAVDFNLYRDGVWLQKSDDHKPLGEFWEELGGSWGGRFGDGNHYSLAHDGRK